MDKLKKKPIFRRKESNKKVRLGRGQKKKLKWRRQKGRHNKIRARMKSYPRQPSIGFGSSKVTFGKVNNMLPILIHNIDDLNKIQKNQLVILAHTSKKNKIKIAKKAQEKGIKIHNIEKKFLERIEKEKQNKTKNKPIEKKTET